jgi:hypothetical protein
MWHYIDVSRTDILISTAEYMSTQIKSLFDRINNNVWRIATGNRKSTKIAYIYIRYVYYNIRCCVWTKRRTIQTVQWTHHIFYLIWTKYSVGEIGVEKISSTIYECDFSHRKV